MSSEKKNILIYSFSGIVLLFLVAFTGYKNHSRKVKSVDVSIAQKDGNYFTDQLEVMDLITVQNSDFLIGSRLTDLKPKVLEGRIEANPFVKDAQVYRDLKGNLGVKVTQSKPIARVFVDGRKDRYIDTDGNILPLNTRHTARVPMLETAFDFNWEENMNETKYGSKIFELLQYIESNDFLRAQIAHIWVRNDGEIELWPQVTRQTIAFGIAEDIEEKFDKLMIFYKKILPKQGWNSYSRVDLRFGDQIICE